MNYMLMEHFILNPPGIINRIAINRKQLELISYIFAETQSELRFSRKLNMLERTTILSYLMKNLNREVKKDNDLKKLGFRFKPMLQPDRQTIAIGFEYTNNRCAKIDGIYVEQASNVVDRIIAEISDPETGTNLFLINFLQEQDSKYRFKKLGANCRF